MAATAGAPSAPATQRESAAFVTRLLTDAPEGASAALDGLSTFVGIPDVTGGAGYRVRTDDIQLGKQEGRPEQGVGGGGRALQVGEKITTDGAPRSQESRTVAPVRSPFVTRLLPGSGATRARLEVLRAGKDGLLSVREAAEQLGLSRATVYRLCADSALPHIRILNAIRIAPADLEAFIETRRGGAQRGR